MVLGRLNVVSIMKTTLLSHDHVHIKQHLQLMPIGFGIPNLPALLPY